MVWHEDVSEDENVQLETEPVDVLAEDFENRLCGEQLESTITTECHETGCSQAIVVQESGHVEMITDDRWSVNHIVMIVLLAIGCPTMNGGPPAVVAAQMSIVISLASVWTASCWAPNEIRLIHNKVQLSTNGIQSND